MDEIVVVALIQPILFLNGLHLILDFFLQIVPQLLTLHDPNSFLFLLSFLLLLFLIFVVLLFLINDVLVYFVSLPLNRQLVFFRIDVYYQVLPRTLVYCLGVVLAQVLALPHRGPHLVFG